MTHTLPFIHHHSYLASGVVLDNLPFYGQFIVKPLLQLTPLKNCPAQFINLQRAAPQSNLIITVASILNGHSLQLLLHDSRTDRLTFYRQYNNLNGRIEGICMDPKNSQCIFMISNDGIFAEIDLFSSNGVSLTLKPIIPKKKTRFTGIVCNGDIIVCSQGSHLYVYDRKTGGQLSVDREMHQSDITCLKFHPQHDRFLFTADESGMINVYEISYKRNPNKNSLEWPSPLDEMYIGTVQIRDGVENFIFFGNDPTNFRYIATVSHATSSVCLIDFNCLDENANFEVIESNMRDLLNVALVKLGNYDPNMFYLEFSDELAEQNLVSNHWEMEERDQSEMAADLDGLNPGAGDMSDTLSVGSSMTTNSIDTGDNELTSPHPTPPSQLALNSLQMLSSALTPQIEDGSIQPDDISHPRVWRVTNILSCHYLPDFTSPEAHIATTQQQIAKIPHQLFISASTSCGGIVTAIIAPTVINGVNQIGIVKLIPSTQPCSAHNSPINDVALLLPSLKAPIYITGGCDGRVALFHTHAANELIKQQYTAVYNEIELDRIRIDQGPGKKKSQRRSKTKPAGKQSASDTTTSNLDSTNHGKVSGGKKNQRK